MSGPTVSLLELRDEFAFVRNDANFADVGRSLGQTSVKVILVRGKKNKGVAGVVSQTHFLKVCATGINPVSTLARNQMQTDLLRLRDDTPLDHAVEAIQEKDPDAVLILSGENKFVGYLSPEDFREIQLGQQKLGGKKGKGPATPPPEKVDVSHSLDLGDEFVFVRNDAIFSDASRMLAPAHVKVILVRAKKSKGIAGVLTEPEFLKVCATGINPNKALVSKHMLTDLLRIRSDTPLDEAVKIIGEKDPDAVLVLNAEKKFVGYLSPADYNEAIELLKKKKIEVFDVPAIKPDFAPPPPPPPELEHEESESDIGLETILKIIRRELGSGYEGPVIWSEDGSEILLHNESVEGGIKGSELLILVKMSCDQTSETTVTVRFDVGTGDPENRFAITDECPEGDPLVVGRWGPVLQQALWNILLGIVDDSTPGDEVAAGFSAGSDGLMIKAGPPMMSPVPAGGDGK